MKLISWNVNGLRAILKKGFEDFFKEIDADIFCIQETKMQEGQADILFAYEYEMFFNSAVKKGYSGTAIFTKIKPINVSYGIGIEEHDQEGRVITLEYEKFYLVNCYTPNSKRELERLDYRQIWEDEFRRYLLKLDKKKPVVLCGDLNVAHEEIDLKNPKSNRGNAGFTDEEREKMTKLLNAGFTDTYRYLYPNKTDSYTWWSYFASAREKNIGWRIDYFIVSKSIESSIQEAYIFDQVFRQRPLSSWIRFRYLGGNMEKGSKEWKKYILIFVLALIAICVYKLLDNFGDIAAWIQGLVNVLMPFIMALLLAYLFYLPCRKLEGGLNKSKAKFIKKRARWISILIVYLIAILAIVLIFKFVIPNVYESIMELANALPGYYNAAIERLNELPEDSIINKDSLKSIIQGLNTIKIEDYINIERLSEYAKGIIGIASSIFNIFVTIIVSMYLLAERTAIINFAKRLCGAIFNKDAYKAIGKYFRESNEIFFRFISSQLLDGIVVGILTSIAMSILGVKFAVLLGFMIGLFNLIPYLGAIIAIVIAGIITLLTGGLTQAIWMIIVVTILQQIDANIINPKITGTSLKISPILIIFSVTVIGSYFGIIGMFLAVPIVAIIKLLISDYIKYKEGNNKNRVENK